MSENDSGGVAPIALVLYRVRSNLPGSDRAPAGLLGTCWISFLMWKGAEEWRPLYINNSTTSFANAIHEEITLAKIGRSPETPN